MKQLITAGFFLLLSLSCFTLNAKLTPTSSIMCADEHKVTIQGISCCTLRISPEKCQEIINSKATIELLERVERSRQAIIATHEAAGSHSIGPQPNCHWNAVATTIPGFFEEDTFLDPYPYADILANHYYRIEANKLRPGDLIEFHEFSQQKQLYNPEAKSYGDRFRWHEFDRAFHSLVYIGEGLIFQKEDSMNATFSIDTLEEAYQVYLQALNSKMHIYKGNIEVRYHRALP